MKKRDLRKQIRKLQNELSKLKQQGHENTKMSRDCKMRLRYDLDSEDDLSNSGEDADDELTGNTTD